MTAKHDGKHARANMWVTQQNLARQKGGRPGFQFKERPPRAKPAPVVTAPAPSDAPDAGAVDPSSEAAPASAGDAKK